MYAQRFVGYMRIKESGLYVERTKMDIIVFTAAFFASVIGVICGVGGGIVIKPVLDMLSVASVSAVSFMSACTALTMSLYSVGRSFAAKEKVVDVKRSTP